ncbi:GAF domain-containing protein [Deinococcus navajonensis]|uniref:GAF domain-containing protein n=1 Tax=Deinococcus navajonensis TaxID=309884 RepID=A0ABV8XNE7_9DEIO
MTHNPALARERRVALVRDLGILDTPPEQSFDLVAQGLARVYQVPVAMVTFLDQDRQFIKAVAGTDARHRPLTETFCQHTLSSDSVLVIPDLIEDDRGQHHPLVTGPPHVRFYAGAPILVDGVHVGTLCIFDLMPRTLSPQQVDGLAQLARMVAITVQARRYGPAILLEAPRSTAKQNPDR